MSQRVLNQTLFHGTSRAFSPGDVVLPASVHKQGSATGAHGDWAFATTDHQMAENYAGMAASTLGGSRHVYTVEPVGEYENDPAYEDDTRAKRSSAGFRVVGEVPRKRHWWSR